MEISILWIEDADTWFNNKKGNLVRRLKSAGCKPKIKRSRHGENISRQLSKPIDFVLCDYNLGGKAEPTLDLLKKIRDRNKYSKIIFYTGDNIDGTVAVKLLRLTNCRHVDRNDVIDTMIEEIESGVNLYAIIDRWLTYYGKQKKRTTFSLLGKEFAERPINSLIQDVRKGTETGRNLTYKLTRYMLSMIAD